MVRVNGEEKMESRYIFDVHVHVHHHVSTPDRRAGIGCKRRPRCGVSTLMYIRESRSRSRSTPYSVLRTLLLSETTNIDYTYVLLRIL